MNQSEQATSWTTVLRGAITDSSQLNTTVTWTVDSIIHLTVDLVDIFTEE